MKKSIFTILLAVAFCCGYAQKDKKTETKTSTTKTEKKDDMKKDEKFAVDAAKSNLMEIEMGEIALKNATSADVKELAQTLVNDHKKAGEGLKSITDKKGIKLPMTLDEKSKKECDELKMKTGADFDKEYSEMVVKGHKKTITMFKKEAETGMDSEIKQWATNTLPTCERHLEMAEDVSKKLKEAKIMSTK